MDHIRADQTMEAQNLLRSKISTPGNAMLKRRLGGGFYHSVHLAEKDGEFFAIKSYDLKKVEADLRSEALKDQIDTEVKALTLLCHPNVMNLEDCFRKASTTRLVLPFFERGDLLSWIDRNGWLSEEQVLFILPPLVDAFEQAQSLKIMHRNIRFKSLFLGADQVVVGSFGSASVGSDVGYLAVGTRPFMAPEMVQNQKYSYGADVWSLGVTLYMSMFCHDPWKHFSYSRPQPGAKLQQGFSTGFDAPINNSNTGANLFFPTGVKISDFLKKIFCSMLQIDPNQRIGWSDLAMMLKASPLLTAMQFDSIESWIQKAANPSESQMCESVREFIEMPQILKVNIESTKKQMEECLKVINEAQIDPKIEKSVVIDQMLDTFVNEEQPSPSSDKNGPEQLALDLKREVVENYIDYHYHMCNFHLRVIVNLLKAVDQVHGLERYWGVFNLAANIISKKTRHIAAYFISKLKSRCSVFTQIGKCPEFYQNGFCGGRLYNFEAIFKDREKPIEETAKEAKKHLKTNFYRREEQLFWAGQIEKFDDAVTEGLFYATFMIIEGVETVDAESQKKMKELVLHLSFICRYKDCVIFEGENNQKDVIYQEDNTQLDPSNLDSNFEQNKEYFRKWKAGLKTN